MQYNLDRKLCYSPRADGTLAGKIKIKENLPYSRDSITFDNSEEESLKIFYFVVDKG